ncbi:hypothetical protein Tco_0684524 [Tanacetum coccineum]
MTSTNSSTATLPFLQNILDLYFKHFKLSEDVVNRILQVILDLQHFKSSPFIFAATILQSSSAIHHISNIDNYVHQIIKFQSILITSSHSLWSSQSFGHQKAINGFDMPLPVAVCSGLVNPLAPRKVLSLLQSIFPTKSPEKMKSPERIKEEDVDTQEEMKEVVKEPGAKRKKSLPRKRRIVKKQKLEEDAEKEELKGFLDIIPREEFAEDVESLSTKYPIVDWKTYTLTENFMYYQVFRGDGSSKNYKVLSEMLEDFDRQDVEELYKLVKEWYSTSRPEGYDLMLWGDLHTLFEPDEEDKIWKNQHEYNVISWSLYDFCGIHILLMQNGIAIHILTEKKYPLSQEMIFKMLKKKLEVDHESSQAFELLRFIRSQVQK